MTILMSIFDRLGVDLASVLGVIFGRFGALVGQSWSQDRLGPPPGPISLVRAHPGGVIWEAKSAPKRSQKRCKNEAIIQESKKPIQDDLGLVLGRSWVVLGVILGPWKRSRHYACRCFVKIHFFDVKTVGRRLWEQL